jgi:sporulation protein YlmC with PRC-barrel domain
MSAHQIHAELLLGCKVRAMNGRVIGRLEEIRVKDEARGCFVNEFLTGSYGMLERLGSLSIGRSILRVLGARNKNSSYRISWDKLDLSDPQNPRLLCEVSELRTVDLLR